MKDHSVFIVLGLARLPQCQLFQSCPFPCRVHVYFVYSWIAFHCMHITAFSSVRCWKACRLFCPVAVMKRGAVNKAEPVSVEEDVKSSVHIQGVNSWVMAEFSTLISRGAGPVDSPTNSKRRFPPPCPSSICCWLLCWPLPFWLGWDGISKLFGLCFSNCCNSELCEIIHSHFYFLSWELKSIKSLSPLKKKKVIYFLDFLKKFFISPGCESSVRCVAGRSSPLPSWVVLAM